jgi:hypothetical protein
MKPMSETHPSLELKLNLNNKNPYYSTWTMEQLLKDVQQHTIDKAVLRNKISQCIENTDPFGEVINPYRLFEELGLEK